MRDQVQQLSSEYIDYLNYDQSLTFVLDLEAYNTSLQGKDILTFCNSALRENHPIHEIISLIFSPTTSLSQHATEAEFATWISDQLASTGIRKSKTFFDVLWTITLLPDRAVIRGIDCSNIESDGFNGVSTQGENPEIVPGQAAILSNSKSDLDESRLEPGISLKSIESTKPLEENWPPKEMCSSSYIAWFRDFDWASTSLGPTHEWPDQLKRLCELMLVNPDPVTVFWGPELILIYNEHYVALAGDKHPQMMGGSAREHWAEIWDQYDSLFDQMILDRQAFKQENTQLHIRRRGFLEEGFFNMRVMPILGRDGSVIGFYEPVSEVTKQVLTERRMHTLLKLSERTSSATALPDIWRLLLEALKDHPSDIHFAELYSLQDEVTSTDKPQYKLHGAVGFKMDHPGLQSALEISDSDRQGLHTALRQAHASNKPAVLSTADGSLSSSFLTKLETVGITEPPRTCIVCPLSCSLDDGIEAMLVIGVNPKRYYNEDYELFVNLLTRQVESTITFVKLFEKEKERLRQQAVFDGELKFKKFAESATVGIFSFDPAGNITFCNESWLELSGHDRNDMSAMSWTNDVHPDSVEDTKKYWDKIVNLEGQQTFEVQYKKPWKPSNLSDDSIYLDRTWVIASAYPEISEEGELTAILGCITDISTWKWVDQLQSQRLKEAIELKRQQENFLDITSHEMRNPLNAILHCAAELVDLLSGIIASTPERALVISDCLDASRTIVYCGRHQKRIIDDVLTLSKLDSNLLSITPVETQPLHVVEEVLKVFDTEIRASNIKTQTKLADSYKNLQIKTLLVDPHRLIQVLINLVANAIKFTKGESLRSLHIVIDAYATEPVSSDSGVRYVPSGRHQVDPTARAEWGTGDIVYLYFSVQDTGPGMTPHEADQLFNRFIQGSPRTHVQYGGSGLGLFISRELAELHGGRIGISSELGFGSTFDFYVKGRRATASASQQIPEDYPRQMIASHKPISRTQSPDQSLPAALPSMNSNVIPENLSSVPVIHVLVVEDNLINQKILAKIIRKQGYAVSIANHGEEALNIVQSSTWHRSPSMENALKLDIVLADIEMPIMDGKEFVRRVRKMQSEGVLASYIPIIAVTGNARNEQVLKAKESGFNEVVSKPYRESDVVSMIENYIKQEHRLEQSTPDES
ncbi:hypothetical protein BT63DRAFT_391916 [Microthyrium microscopicum]|uniref:Aerobic respiration control sensor protein arcB n=1 Tax=Microthyrium microscopicum TaxID=703497 RepID=A0A6A6U3X0_9PEZI|nr:hypothetical protein BT63DRAFT_391916 [Microthyrium microscopicum]